ncbi:uncharacterized protein LOC130966600 [Arachis stenosperma]|uniref:uncharacterized protein LOC130966600 n=1 Tax=Arachis stenosperma TaxID=217475 RepID=UPI0025ABC1D7|nr:uncharacterized protein LOC130966600 [Arachis stenosperma]
MNNHPAPLSTPEYWTRMPYPQKICQAEKDRKFAKFVDYLKTLEIKIPFAKALEQIPSYAKFMKDILSHKKDWREVETVFLIEECSAVIQRNLPEKLQDPGSFVIPCNLGDAYIMKALCDLGATKNPSGVIEDMIVRVGPFTFPTDFVVLNMKEHKNVSLILGRPFLAIGRTLIDVEKRRVTLRVNEDEFVLDATKAMQYFDIPEECMKIDITDSLVEEIYTFESQEKELNDILVDACPDREAS